MVMGETIDIYRLETPGERMVKIASLRTALSKVAPRLYKAAQGGLILFVAGQVLQDRETESLSIYFFESSDGVSWEEKGHFIQDEDLRQNFLPYYAYKAGWEYVIFQSLYTSGEANTYQLYLKSRQRGGRWSKARLITSYEEEKDGEKPPFYLFDNQRPHFVIEDGRLYLSWERSLKAGNPQIAYGVLNRTGKFVLAPEEVSQGLHPSRAPRVIRYSGETMILWFEDQGENKVVLARRGGIFWEDRVISKIAGHSIYGEPLFYDGDLVLLWENRLGLQRNIAFLFRDRTALPPLVEAENFENRGKVFSEAQVRWSSPFDSSGIWGFRYEWTQEADFVLDRDTNQLDLQDGRNAFKAPQEGLWYFYIALIDYAGNWSETVRLEVEVDLTPPVPVQFLSLPLDDQGFLENNSPTFEWFSQEETPLGFSYVLDYLGPNSEAVVLENLELSNPGTTVQTVQPRWNYENLKDGLWAFTASTIDSAGGVGRGSTYFFKTNKFVPRVLVHRVLVEGEQKLTVLGEGFLKSGTVHTLLLDRDGKAPWDYEYALAQGDYSIPEDGRLEGLSTERLEEGDYQLILLYQGGNKVTAPDRIRLGRSGTIRYGDYGYEYKDSWTPLAVRGGALGPSLPLVLFVLFFLWLIIIYLSIKLGRALKEGRELKKNADAVIKRMPLMSVQKEDKGKGRMKGRVGLFIKIATAITILLLGVIVLVTLILGQFMIRNRRELSIEQISSKAQLLLGSLNTGARTYLPSLNSIELGLLPKTIEAMDEAISVTITGRGEADPDNYYYIWASNKENIQEYQLFPKAVAEKDIKFPAHWDSFKTTSFKYRYFKDGQYDFADLPEGGRQGVYEVLLASDLVSPVIPGVTILDDPINKLLPQLEEEINNLAKELVGEQGRELDALSSRALGLLRKGDPGSLIELGEVQNTIVTLEKEVEGKLDTLRGGMRIYPDIYGGLSYENAFYTLYEPIIYRSPRSEVYFRGVVRLEISIQSLLEGEAAMIGSVRRITLYGGMVGLIIGLLGAFLMTRSMVRPIRTLMRGVNKVRDTQDKTNLSGYIIQTKSKDELGELTLAFNQMTHGLVEAARAGKELTLGKEIQKKFIPLEGVPGSDRKLSTGRLENDFVQFFGYYEGAKGVSGDYFDYRQLDEDHFATIKCDISGKGISASLIMIEVATIFIDYCSKVNIRKEGIHLEKLVYQVNDLLNEIGFKGRFAAFMVSVFNVKTGQLWICHAGDRNVHYYNAKTRKLEQLALKESPAAGVFPSFMVQGQKSYVQYKNTLPQGNILFFFTDGLEEAQRRFRNQDLTEVPCDGSCIPEGGLDTHKEGEVFEEFGLSRVKAIVEAVTNRGTYELKRFHEIYVDHPLRFDFSTGTGSLEEVILSLIGVEKIFRLIPDPQAGPDDRIRIDKKIDEFLRRHFEQYWEYFRYPIPDEEYPEYNYYSHLREDEQFDDLTILGVRRR